MLKVKNCCILIILFSLIKVHAQISPNAFVPCQEMPNLMQDYQADYQQLNNFYTAQAGNHWYMHESEDLDGSSNEKLKKLQRCNNMYLEKLTQVDFSGLPQECKVDYILFKRNLEANNQKIKESLEDYVTLQPYFSFADLIYYIGQIRRRGGNFAFEKVAFQYDSIAKEIPKTISLFQMQHLSLPLLKSAEAKIKDLVTTLDWVDNFYKGYNPSYTWWLKTPQDTLRTALAKYEEAIVSKEKDYQFHDGSNIVGVPIGRNAILQQLNYEMIPYSPEELIGFAEKEFLWCDKEMLKASKELGFGSNWKSAVEKVKNSYVPIGEQPALINDLYDQSIAFVKKYDMITIPSLAEETWGMDMMSPERQKVNPFFTGGNEITISYPTEGMSGPDKLMSMKGNNPHFSRSTVFHELIPGHNLEFYMMRRNRTYRNFSTPFWIEGWSLYWELLMWDAGFPRNAEDRIGMLFWHMTRCARIIFSLNYHLGKWSPQQCIDYLVDRVDYERANAEGEVRRSFEGSYEPLYQVGYLVGGQQLMALKKELVGNKIMTLKQYNDHVMSLNAMPIEMVRAILTQQPLDKNFQTKWHFYDSLYQ